MSLQVYPSEVLGNPTNKVENVEEVKDIIEELWCGVRSNKGVGMAANQLGYDVSVCVINNPNDGDMFVMINPEIVDYIGSPIMMHEGCLSLPGVSGKVKRYFTITVSYTDEDDELHYEEFTGNTAHIIQHEVDHLSGMLYIDRMNDNRRSKVIRKYEKKR